MIALSVRVVILIALVAGAHPSFGPAAEANQAVSVTSSMADGGDCGGEDTAGGACLAPCLGGCAALAAATAITGARVRARWSFDQRRVSGITSLPLPTPPRF